MLFRSNIALLLLIKQNNEPVGREGERGRGSGERGGREGGEGGGGEVVERDGRGMEVGDGKNARGAVSVGGDDVGVWDDGVKEVGMV